MRVHDLKNLVERIEDEKMRDEHMLALSRWHAAAPRRTPPESECPGCGTKGWEGKGRLCGGCMTNIIQSAVTETKGHSITNRVPAYIERTVHYNEYPRLSMETRVEPESPFHVPRSPRDEDRPMSPTDAFHNMLQEVLRTVFAAWPAIPAGQRSYPLFKGSHFGTDKHEAMVPSGFGGAIRRLAFFVSWATEQAYLEGQTKGQNLLTQLSVGDITMDHFDDALKRQMEIARRKAEANEKEAAR